ncbi:hypothetical protein [Microbacterium sp. A93]|uniref:hypothetical protein n=1 Tax=Microbacterium sp. A93 TaxID=3450716 RepID=UPI003F42B2F8
MTSTNRTLNRVVLVLCALLLTVAGAAALLWAFRPGWAEEFLTEAERLIAGVLVGAAASTVTISGVGDVPIALIAALLAALILAVALTIFVFARGRGDVREVSRMAASDGRTDVDRNVVDVVLTGALTARPDVLSSRTGVYLVRGTRTVRLAVTVRQGASLGDVLAAAERAIKDWDSLLGGEIPILIHLTDRGWLDRYRSAIRVR